MTLPTNHTCRLNRCFDNYKLWCFTFHTGRKRASGVPCGSTPIQEAILQALQRDGELCADAEFLNGLLPSLKRLPPDAKEYVKFQIHKVIFDATQFTLNLEPV